MTEAALKQLDGRLPAGDAAMMSRMIHYLNRNNLILARVAGSSETLVCEFANDCERFRISLGVLRDLHARLASGEAIDWDSLERLK